MRTPNIDTATWERSIRCSPGACHAAACRGARSTRFANRIPPPPHHLDRDIPRYRAMRAVGGHATPPRLGAQGTRTAPRSWRRALQQRFCCTAAARRRLLLGPSGSSSGERGRGPGPRHRPVRRRGGLPAPPSPGASVPGVPSAARGPTRPGGCVAGPRRMGRRCSDSACSDRYSASAPAGCKLQSVRRRPCGHHALAVYLARPSAVPVPLSPSRASESAGPRRDGRAAAIRHPRRGV